MLTDLGEDKIKDCTGCVTEPVKKVAISNTGPGSPRILPDRCYGCLSSARKPNYQAAAKDKAQQKEGPARGLRYNKGKRRYDLLPPDTMALLADLLTRGAEKYAERNWELGMPYSDALGSLERHLMDWKAGVDNDDETKMSHMIHVMCNAMFLATWQARKVGTDDRQRVTMPEPYVSSTNPSAS